MRSAAAILAIAMASAGLAMAVAGSAQNAGGSTQAPAPSWRHPAADAARGEQLAQICLTCHRADSPQVDPPAPRLLHQRQSYVFRALWEYREGQRKSDVMAPFVQGLSDQNLRDIAAYVSGEMLDVPPRAHVEMPAYSTAIKECTWCHGETGIGEFESMPVLTGQKAEYLERALQEYRSGARSDPTMRAVTERLDPASDAGPAAYFSAHDWLEDAE